MKPNLKHLPVDLWPDADRQAFAHAFEKGDIFDETAGCGAHLSKGTRVHIKKAYRRWLGFIATHHPDDLEMEPGKRLRVNVLAGRDEQQTCKNRLSCRQFAYP